MVSGQQFLFAPEKPLVRRLGKKFFHKILDRPGVYKMHDAKGEVVYVGKARNLRQRLRSYRVANPERMPRRHLRMVPEVAWIDFELCRNESAALGREARLLRRLKPKFNRAGVWPGRAQFLTWRFDDQTARFSVQEIPPPGWERFGPLGGYAPRLHGSVVRLLWLVCFASDDRLWLARSGSPLGAGEPFLGPSRGILGLADGFHGSQPTPLRPDRPAG